MKKRDKKVRGSLRKRLMHAFSLVNMITIILMFAMTTFFIGFSLHIFSGLLSESVASQMAEALSKGTDMPLQGLGEPYRLTALQVEDLDNQPTAMYLIQYQVLQGDKVVYDSTTLDKGAKEFSDQISEIMLMNRIYDEHTAPYMDRDGKIIGYVRVTLNNILVFSALIGLLVITIIGTVSIVLISQVAIFMVGPNVIRPIKELETRMGAMADGVLEGVFDQSITFKRPVREVVALSEHANRIMGRMNGLVENLKAQNVILDGQMHQIQTIFQQVDQGIFHVSSEGTIQDAYSLECERLLGGAIADKRISHILYPSNNGEQAFFEELLQQIFFSEGMSQSVFLSLLPDQLTLNGFYMSITYKMISHKDHELDAHASPSLMVILTNQTEKRALEQQMHQEQSVLKMVVKAMIHSDEIIQLLHAYKQFAETALELYDQGELPFLLREIHTLKGNFAQYDWSQLAQHLNALEDQLLEDTGQETQVSAILDSSNQQLRDGLSAQQLLEALNQDFGTIRQFAGEGFLEETALCLVSKERILQVEARIKEILSSDESREILPLIRALRYQSVKDRLRHYQDYVQKLSERLEKAVAPLAITGDDILVDPDIYADTFRNFVHIFRNSLDHGLESPLERLQNGKPEQGKITLDIKRQGHGMLFTFTDDGRGIDMDALAQKRHKKSTENKVHTGDAMNTANNDSQDSLNALIFEAGLSVKDEATMTSGKGYGLSALKVSVERMKGTVVAYSEVGQGTRIEVLLPLVEAQNGLTSGTELMTGLETSVESLLVARFGMGKTEKRNSSANQITLNQMTAIVNLKGTLNMIVMISVSKPLIYQVAPHLLLYPCTEDEVVASEDDILGELANTLIGNALRDFNHREDVFQLGIPVIMSHSEGYVKYSQDSMLSTEFNFGDLKLDMHLIPIHSEYIIKHLEEA